MCGAAGIESVFPANRGHRFRFTFSSAGSYKVVGDEHHHDAEDWSPEYTVEVRAWNLNDALKQLLELPLAAWFPEEDGVDDGQ